MKASTLPAIGLLGLLAGSPIDAVAQTAASPATDRETHVSSSLGVAAFTSEEHGADDQLLNHEAGRLWHTAVVLDHARGAWAVRAAFRQGTGTVDYRGQTQLGLPLLTRTGITNRELDMTVGYRWRPAPLARVGVVGGAETLRTTRDIHSTAFSTELTETLTSQRWVIGPEIRGSLPVVGRLLRIAASLQFTRPWSQDLSVDTHGVTDALTLEPQPRWSQRLEVEATCPVGPSVDIGISASHEILHAGASPAVTAYRGGLPVGSASYPGNEQRVQHVSVVANWHF